MMPVMLVCALGDSVLDVIVSVADGLALDDDVPAAISLVSGGQAVNVAAWVQYAGAAARYLGPRSTNPTGAILDRDMRTRGIELTGPTYAERPGAVVSVISGGRRSMASDAGKLGWPEKVFAADLRGADWLMISGYTIYRLDDPTPLVALASRARGQGVRIGIDLSSAQLLLAYGRARTAELIGSLAPTTVFANDAEWSALHTELSFDLVLKHGAAGCSFYRGDGVLDLPPEPTTVLDTTGAGDALAAGYLVGGPTLAMQLAARCVAQVGAQPALT